MIRVETQGYERIQPSYLMGALVGATAAAALMRVTLAANPFLFGTIIKEAVSELFQTEASHLGTMATGAAIGAASGLIRTAIDRRYGHLQEQLPTSIVLGVAYAALFSHIGGVPRAVLTPFAIVGELVVKGMNANRIQPIRVVVLRPEEAFF